MLRPWHLFVRRRWFSGQQRAAQAKTAAVRRAPAAPVAPVVPVAPARTAHAYRPVQTTAFKPSVVPPSGSLSGVNRVPLFCDHCNTSGHSKKLCKRYNNLCHTMRTAGTSWSEIALSQTPGVAVAGASPADYTPRSAGSSSRTEESGLCSHDWGGRGFCTGQCIGT